MSTQLSAQGSETFAVAGIQLQIPSDLASTPQSVTDADGNVSGLQLSSADGTTGGPTVIQNSLGIGAAPAYPLHVASGQTVRLELGGGTALSMGAPGTVSVDAVSVPGGRFFIADDGNVGINNPNPQYSLDVQGTINATGLSIPGSVSMLGSPVALQLPAGFPLSQNNDYLVDTDGWVVGVVGGDYLGGQQWGALSVSYTTADGTYVSATASGANTAATGTVMDASSSCLTVPVPNGTTFTLQFWGGKYGAPGCQAWFYPMGAGTATLQSS